ncbi:hypothetical protein EYF80_052472 [Liparis tanakae]|uniref:Uncharacterized protein n=1 Tax=Liparis tanakae TaxID=230148 RepID=A0A4Z2F921_9TELE|nr:hypothetical protein EYF80_052472 [Liparis tanakae]
MHNDYFEENNNNNNNNNNPRLIQRVPKRPDNSGRKNVCNNNIWQRDSVVLHNQLGLELERRVLIRARKSPTG